MRYFIFALLMTLMFIICGASGDKPNQMVISKFMGYSSNGVGFAPETCTKGEMQMAGRRLYYCYSTNNQWTFLNISSAAP